MNAAEKYDILVLGSGTEGKLMVRTMGKPLFMRVPPAAGEPRCGKPS